MNFRKITALTLAALIISASMYSCGDNTAKKPSENGAEVNAEDNSGAKENISLPAGEDKKEEIIINENYADSELYDFTGTVDEIYEDGSMLVYSPDFRVNFDYKVIVEKDANTVVDGFTVAENQHIQFEVYSSVKKSEPLTVVAAKLTLLNEVSTQREEEAKRIEALESKAQETLKNPVGTQK